MATSKIGIIIPTWLQEKLFSPSDRQRIGELGEAVWTDSETQLSAEDAGALLADCDIAVGSWGTPGPQTEGVLAAASNLKLWVHAAGSVKNMFGPHLDGRDLRIDSCAAAIGEAVAEWTLGVLILGLKGHFPNAAANREGKTGKPKPSRTLMESTIGIVGASQVGRRVIRNLQRHHPRLLVYDPYLTAEGAKQLGVEKRDSVLEMCREVDAISLHTPAVPACEKILSAECLAALNDNAVVVNCARGMCLDEDALITECEKGRLFAILDVSKPEPAAEDSPLRKLPNVMYTSHIAGGPSWFIGRQVADDINAFQRGEALTGEVTADMLDRLA